MARDTSNPRVAEINGYVTRRRLLQGAAGAGASLLAGCSGDGDAGTGRDAGSGGGGDDPVTLTFPGGEQPNQLHMNGTWGPPNHVSHGDRFGRILFDPLVFYHEHRGETTPLQATDWGIENEQLELELRDQTWHNGDPYTTESIALFYEIQSMIDEHNGETSLMGQFVEDWEVVDDTVMRFDLTDTWNPAVYAQGLLFEQMYPFHPDHWTQWRDDLQDAGPGTDEFQSVLDDLSEHTDVTVDGQEFLGYGPFQFVDADSTTIILEKYDDHPMADEITFDRVRWDAHSEPKLAWLEDDVDISFNGFPVDDDLQSRMPSDDDYDLFGEGDISSYVLVMNAGLDQDTDRPVFQREIRHALSFVFDEENVASGMPTPWNPWTWVQANSHYEQIEADTWDLDGFTDHGVDEERAIELIDAADGYSYEDGQVMEENGEQATIDILTGAEGPILTVARVVADDLEAFGWDVTVSSVDGATYTERRSAGEYDIFVNSSGVYATRENFKSSRIMGYWQDRMHFPHEVEVPMPVGEANLSPDAGETETLDLTEYVGQMESSTDDAAIREATQTMMWVWNQYAPMYQCVYRKSAGALHSPFAVTTDDEVVRNAGGAHWQMIHDGTIEYRA